MLDSINDIINIASDFLFGSYEGIAILFIGFIIITLIIAAILEKRTKKIFKDCSNDTNKDYDNKHSK